MIKYLNGVVFLIIRSGIRMENTMSGPESGVDNRNGTGNNDEILRNENLTKEQFLFQLLKQNQDMMAMMNRMMSMSFTMNVAGSTNNANNSVPTPSMPPAHPPTAFHVMPDLNKNIPDFTGDKSNMLDAKAWLEQLKNMKTLLSWPDSFCLETARAHLTGPAAKWYATYCTEMKDWNMFQARFRKAFIREMDETEKWDAMHNRRQGKDEASISYFYDKVRLCKELNLSIEAIKRSKDLVFQIVGKSFNDVDDILAEIQMYEKVDKSRQDD